MRNLCWFKIALGGKLAWEFGERSAMRSLLARGKYSPAPEGVQPQAAEGVQPQAAGSSGAPGAPPPRLAGVADRSDDEDAEPPILDRLHHWAREDIFYFAITFPSGIFRFVGLGPNARPLAPIGPHVDVLREFLGLTVRI